MRLSVIVPSRPSEPSLPRTLRSLEAASRGLDVETVLVRDESLRGLSWARNEGLRRATGDAVFFVDADDTVRPGFFRRLSETLEESGADFALSSFDYAPLRRGYNLAGNAAIREAMLPAFFGYSFDDVRRWNAGGDLHARREQGSVCRCAFRRGFLERHAIRFDEGLRLYEDSPFIAECAALADRVASIPDVLYDYVPGEGSILATSLGTDRYFDYKFAALENRKAIAARVGGGVMGFFAASAAFSAMELLKARRDWRRYAADPFVAESLRAFPRSPRHPLAAAAVAFLSACAR
ncbi:MAG: glycosyltransferase [Kiritimatiellae bacterium]|nr:glycosyltransferase [Kiritimatiellia bacterium]